MFNALKSQRISLQILLPFIGFLPFIGLVIWPASGIPETHNVQGWLYSTYRELLASSPRLLLYGSFAITALFSSYLFWVNTRFELTGSRTVLLSYMFLFVVCTPLYNSYLHPAFLGILIIFIGLTSIFGIYHRSQHLTKIFNGGMAFGLAFLCFPPFLVLIPIFFLAIARLKQPGIRDFIIFIFGFLAVVWIYVAILFLNGSLGYEWTSITQWFELRHTWPIPLSGSRPIQFAWFIWIMLMLPMALVVSRSKKDVGRRVNSVLIQFLWLTPLLLILFERVSFEIWGLLSVPMAVLFSLAVMNTRKNWISNLMFLSLLIFMILFQLERFI